ncbi:MAG: PAS domain S-box protein [Deltaproteobacteria bacterium]|uniref:histidine kinase n=1 Tax=Candidatus Zymogenus saltonus TaxID=2844893 RepID=A0A9D8KGV0_9DELT|nr:PAS domain S-box protein [Candidatus Zymogenus saltonus]
MKGKNISKDELLKEVAELRRQSSELKKIETENKKVLEALRESEERYRHLCDASMEGVAIHEGGIIIDANRAFAEMFGYERGEVIGINALDLSDQSFRDRISKGTRSKREEPCEAVGIRKDGSTFIGELHAKEIIYKGKDVGLITIRDITERKLAVKALRESEEKYRSVVDNAREGISITQDWLFKYANKEHNKILGCEIHELISKPFIDFIHEDDRDMILERYKMVLRGENIPGKTIIRIKTKSGQLKWVELKAMMIKWGRESVALTFMEDITEARNAELALRESEELKRSLLDASAVGLAFSEDRKVIWANETMVKMFGFTDEKEYVGKSTLSLYVDEEEYNRVGKLIYEGLKSGEVIETDSQFRRKNGAIFYGNVRVSVLDPSNPMKGIIVSILDITERKRAEETLRESEEKYRSILSNIEDGYYEVNLSGDVTFFNNSANKIIKYSEEELMRMNFRDFMDEKNAKKVFRTFYKVFKTRRPTKAFDWELIRKDGTKIYVEVSVSMKTDKDGNPTGFSGLIRDITERKNTEESLRKSEEKYRTILGSIEDGYYEVDLKGNMTFFNDSTLKIIGYSREELMGMNNRELMDEENAKKIYKTFSRVFKTGRPIKTLDWEYIRKDGTKIYIEVSVSLRTDQDGNPMGFRGLFRDITIRKRAEKALRESEAKYRDLIENAVDLIFTIDMKGNILKVNEAFLKETGCRTEEAIGTSFTDHLIPLDETISMEAYKEIKFGETRNFELRAKKKDGSIDWYSFVTRPLYDTNSKVSSVHCIARNVTERKRLEEELMDAQKMKAVGTLAGGIAHDFNNIMATILGYASFLRGKTEKGDSFYKGLSAIEKSAIRASELTAHLLAYSRKGKIEIKPININTVVKNVHEIISGTFQKSITIDLNISPKLDSIEGDISQMNQVVLNLALNAREAMPEGGTIKIETYMEDIDSPIRRVKYTIEPGRYVCLRITDDGIGMDKYTLSRVFEPYFTTKREKTSTGLGMSVVYGIVKGHNGYFDIVTEQGKGTEITVYIPASKKEVESNNVEVVKSVGGTETIMVIDDEKEVLSMVESALADAGYKVLIHSSGEEALNAYRKKPKEIGLVILDVIMPEISCEEVLKGLLAVDENVKVLLASGYSNEERHNDLIELGASDFIGKPFMIDELLGKVRNTLNGATE